MAGGAFSSDSDVISEINVTPLVDVVLVLLVIFMVTAPVIYQSAIKVQLPQARSGEQTSQQSPLNFAIDREGAVTWGTEKVDWAQLGPRLEALVKATADPTTLTALISADQATPHGAVVRLMDALRLNGLTRFALNVEASTPGR
jgi:biopolymer transport protein ExbD